MMLKFKRLIGLMLALFMLLPCLPVYPAAVAVSETWLVPDAGARQTVTVRNPTTAVLRNMPVLVRLAGTNIPNKDGVSFYAGTTRLTSELASWNAGGVCTYWVKVPELVANDDTNITAYYSGSSVEAPVAAADVWSDGYELVQHFSESAVSAASDSTGNGTLTKTGTLTYKQDNLGGAAAFTGSQKISYNNRVIGANAAAFSVSAVVNFTELAGTSKYYGLVCRDRNATKEGDTFMLTLSNANANASVYTNGSSRVNAQKAIAAGTAYLLTMTYDGSNLNLYINGALADTKPATNATLLDSALSPFTIGAYSDAAVTNGLKGDLYDVFFKTSAISADEETFRHANYLGNAVTAGTLETRSMPLLPGSHYLYDAVVADTYCYSNGEDGRAANFGSEPTVLQKRTNVSDAPDFQSSANRRAFVKLDLTQLATVAPERIESVTFDFFQTGSSGTTNSVESRIVDVAPDSWEESTLTWLNMPSTYSLPAAATQTITKKDKQYQSFDVTNYIKEKLAAGKTLISFSIDNEPASEWGMIWSSREAAENQPRLTVNIKAPDAPVLSTEINGTSAVLRAQLDQDPQDATDVSFYKAKTIPVTGSNAVVYSGETNLTLPDGLKASDAEQTEPAGAGNKTTVGNGKTPYQIYEITLSEEEKTQGQIEVAWSGNTAGQQRDVTAYYYSTSSDRWIKADSGSGEGTFSLNITVPVGDALNENGKIQILFWRGLNEAIDGRSSYAPGTGQYDFNLMWTTDTQCYTDNLSGIPHVKKQFDWIVKHYDEMKSKMFIHTGDMVEHYDNAEEWQAMSDMYRDTIEKAKIPYAFTVGNHDVNRGNSSLNIFQNYFPVSRLQQNNPYFGESLDDMTYYYTMEERGVKLMFVGLGIPITQEAVNWVNAALASHPDYTAILLPHIYLKANGEIDDSGRYGAEVTVEKLRTIIEDNENVRLVLCGHWNGASTRYEEIGGRPVWALMHDYQDEREGGFGYFRFLKFDLENNLIYTHTYSASDNGTAMFTDQHSAVPGMYQKHRDEYAISFDFGAAVERSLTTETIGLKTGGAAGDQLGATQTVTGSGGASVVWDGLEQGGTYSWYAVFKDGENNETVSGIQTFTVPKVTIDNVSYSGGTVTVQYTADGVKDGTPLGIMAFAVGETDGADTVWNGQNVAYQDVFAYSSGKNVFSFPMPRVTANGIAGLDTTKVLLIKIGGEATNTAAKLFVLPFQPAIVSAAVDGNAGVTVRLNRPMQDNEVLLAAAYDDKNRLVSVAGVNQRMAAAALSSESESEYTVSVTVPENAAAVKVMWCKSLDTLQPICEMKEVEKAGAAWLLK